MRKAVLALAIWAALALGIRVAIEVLAAEPATASFGQTWARTDEPVAAGLVDRTWLWGPAGNTAAMPEPYTEAPGGERTVQYFDKSRMEDNGFRAVTPWDVTNGLLVVELVTGRMQVGDDDFVQYAPAEVNVAGDQDDQAGIEYATVALLLDEPALADGETITQRVDQAGNVKDEPLLASYGVTAAERVTVPGIDHQVASPFWQFMNSNGTVYENGAYVDAAMFLNAFYATGYPITEAYWAEVKVGGIYQDVLLQCFERRCLTFTPDNPEGWQVEAGNVGLHYYEWRYHQIQDEAPDPVDPSATATLSPTEPPVTGTPPAQTPSPTETAEPSPTATAQPTGTATASPTEAVEREFSYIDEFGGPIEPDTELIWPMFIAIDASDDYSDYVYVTDPGSNRVYKFSPLGALVTWWGDDVQFDQVMGIAVDAEGNVYVSDVDGDRVKKFTSEGEYLDEWYVDRPIGLAIDSQGYIYVVDHLYHRILKFDSEGNLILEWGEEGNVDLGDFYLPQGIAIDANDIVYVTDTGNDRVQKFDSVGTPLGEWGGSGSTDGLFESPNGIAIDASGIVYVVDENTSRIQGFDENGAFLGKWGGPGSGTGQFMYPDGIAIDSNGRIYVGDSDNGRVQVFDANRSFLDAWTDGLRGRIADTTFGMAYDRATQEVYLGDDTYDRIQVFDSQGYFWRVFGEPGSGAGQLNGANALAASLDGRIYAVDRQYARVIVFQRNGTYVTEWDGGGQLVDPVGIDVDRDGNVYVTDAGTDMVLKFDNAGILLAAWGEPGSGESQFNYPADIAVRGDLVYVVDHNNHRIQVFDRNGVYLNQWGELGVGDGQFAEPQGIAFGGGRDGVIYVADTGNHRVQAFTVDGQYLGQFGSEGSGDGQFSYPTRIEATEHGEIFVLDALNHRVQIFRDEVLRPAV
jgi:DNA-binding beta-propeller fold protein YncE